MSKKPILIVGGGIGGLTTALALSRKGYATLVLERGESFREIGYGIILCPNVFKVFDFLGILEKMKEFPSYPDFLIWADGTSLKPYFQVPMKNASEKLFGYPYGSFHRGDILRALLDECKKSPLIELKSNESIVKIEEKNQFVQAFSKGGTEFEGSALIGADGLWSFVRTHILNDGPPRPARNISYRGFIPVSEMPPELVSDSVMHLDLPAGHIVHYPAGRNKNFNIVAEYESSNSEEGVDKLFQAFSDAPPHIQKLLNYIDTSKKWKIHDREPSKNWSRGRITLIGDAAHPTVPHMTQGAGMAIEDGYVLAEKISECDGRFDEAFQAYQEERYLRCAHVQIFSRLYNEMHHSHGVKRELRNQLFSNTSLDDYYRWVGIIYKGIDIRGKS